MDEIFLNSWVNNPIYARIVSGLLTILLGFVIARIVGLLTYRILQALELNRILKKTGFSFRSEQWLAGYIEITLYAAAIIWAFYIWRIHIIAVYAILCIAVVLAITLLLNLRSMIANLISGFKIRTKVREGQRIRAGNSKGIVSAVRLTYTMMIGRNKEQIAVPNSFLAKSLKH